MAARGAFLGTAVIDNMFEVQNLPVRGNAAVVASSYRAFGGRAAGAASTFGMLGGKAVLFSAVGNDFVESGFEQFLTHVGVDLAATTRSGDAPCYSTNTYVEIGTGEAYTFLHPTDLEETISEAQLDTLGTVDFLYVAGFYPHRPIERCLQFAASHGLRTAVNFCNGLVPYASDALLTALLQTTSIAFFNDDEWLALQSRIGLTSASDLFRYAPSLVCAFRTRGATAGQGHDRGGREWEIPVRPIEKLSSTVGAGDTFAASTLFGIASGLDFVTASHLGSLLATLKVEKSSGATFLYDQLGMVRSQLKGFVDQWQHRA